jgi:molecular chaperone GrpE
MKKDIDKKEEQKCNCNDCINTQKSEICENNCNCRFEKEKKEDLKNQNSKKLNQDSCKKKENDQKNDKEEIKQHILDNDDKNNEIDKLNQIKKKIEEENIELKKNLLKTDQNLLNERLKYKAELENFKKRLEKEKKKEIEYASFNLIKDMIIPFEQLEKIVQMETENELLNKFLSGFKIIFQQMKEVLEKNGVQEIKSLGEKFNPNFHYAIEKISDKSKPNNINISVLQKGFIYKNLIIKPSMVKINEWSDENENK